MKESKVLILGSTGMLGYVLFTKLSESKKLNVYGTIRDNADLIYFSNEHKDKIIVNVDANNFKTVENVLESVKPDIVVNCIGLIKQLPISNKPVHAISINSLFPHQLVEISTKMNIRMVHFSTDCVFDGKSGDYKEDDLFNAMDLYGRTKYLGEVTSHNSITIRTSIIGHELKSKHGLIEWFLSQEESVKGYNKAIFSGLPTIEMARILRDFIFPNENLNGLYHVSSNPISKYRLLDMVANTYGKKIDIERDEQFSIDRSLNSTLFQKLSGYTPPPWEVLIQNMYHHYIENYTHLSLNEVEHSHSKGVS